MRVFAKIAPGAKKFGDREPSLKVLILGDSTSFSGGFAPRAYPVALAAHPIWPQDTIITNPSVAGMTSADAALYCRRYTKTHGQPDLTVIYLGNCDACATRFPKGTTGWFASRSAKRNRARAAKQAINIMRPYAFDPAFDLSVEAPESPADYDTNLSTIMGDLSGTKVVLVAPVAHRRFIAGSGKGNFLFYRIFRLAPTYLSKLTDVPEVLTAPFDAEITGDIEKAAALYEEAIARESQPTGEVLDLARHNLAVLQAELERTVEATDQLKELVARPMARPEIAIYNLSRIRRAAGDLAEADHLLNQAFESDHSIYRVKPVYADIARQHAERHSNAELVDMAAFAEETAFIDHCHMTGEHQDALAYKIISALEVANQKGVPARLDTCPVTPEYAFGDDRLLSQFLYQGRNASPDTVERIADAAAQHPLFADRTDIERRPPTLSGELGRFHEAYTTRLLAPYLQQAADNKLFDLFSEGEAPAPLSARLTLLNDDVVRQIDAELGAEITATPERVAALKALAVTELQRLSDTTGVAEERIRTVIYWYFRESARFGSHSSLDMLWRRTELEQLKELVLAIAVLGDILGTDEFGWCKDMAAKTSALATTLSEETVAWLENYYAAR
jgi:lysophospholipase L1-like esterase